MSSHYDQKKLAKETSRESDALLSKDRKFLEGRMKEDSIGARGGRTSSVRESWQGTEEGKKYAQNSLQANAERHMAVLREQKRRSKKMKSKPTSKY